MAGKMKMSQQQMIDSLIQSLEDMIDASKDMWEEKKHCNHKEMQKIKDDRYEPAKNQIKRLFTVSVEEIIKRNKFS